jgi:hypothetical protein
MLKIGFVLIYIQNQIMGGLANPVYGVEKIQKLRHEVFSLV